MCETQTKHAKKKCRACCCCCRQLKCKKHAPNMQKKNKAASAAFSDISPPRSTEIRHRTGRRAQLGAVFEIGTAPCGEGVQKCMKAYNKKGSEAHVVPCAFLLALSILVCHGIFNKSTDPPPPPNRARGCNLGICGFCATFPPFKQSEQRLPTCSRIIFRVLLYHTENFLHHLAH